MDINPKEIYNHLNRHVIGQDQAKKVLSVAVYDHYLRVNHPELNIEKSNILLCGPTGCGKTLLVKVLAKFLHMPVAISDATALTQAGYVGEDVENVLLRLIQEADNDVRIAEKGICIIDEIDKLGRKSESASITRDVAGEGVQQALLKLIEGSTVNVPAGGGRKRPDGIGYIPIDTTNILFICSGAFEGLQLTGTPEDATKLKKFGMMPELLGRLPVVTQVNKLNESELAEILIDPENSIIQQMHEQFAINDVNLTFDDKALRALAHHAYIHDLGARGLRSSLEKVLLEFKFNIDDYKGQWLMIDEAKVKAGLQI